MNVFVVHKSNDLKAVEKLIERLSKKVVNTNFLILIEGNKNWKAEAKEKIKCSDCILVALGEHTHESKFIDYEIELSKKLNKKIFLIRLNDKQDIINKSLFLKDKFMEVKYHRNFEGHNRPLFKEIKEEDFIKIVSDGFDFDLQAELNKTKDPKRVEELIEQYKVYLATSEDVVTRRQNASSFYIGINTVLMGVMTTITSLFLGLSALTNKAMLIAIITLFTSLLGIVLCTNWFYLIDSYGKLNSAKMKVISTLEKELPANIYDTEWRVMNEKVGNTKYRSFTSIEKRVPLTFFVLYFSILLVSIIILVITIFKGL